MKQVDSDTVRLIADLCKNYKRSTVAAVLDVSDSTVKRYKNAPAPAETGTEDITQQQQYTTRLAELSSACEKIERDDKTYQYYAMIVYPESAEDWLDKLINTGIAFAVSPLHDKDQYSEDSPAETDSETGEVIPKGNKYKAGDFKKAHNHIVLDYGERVAYRNAKALAQTLNAPTPQYISGDGREQILRKVAGAYEYLNHSNAPTKYQYPDEPTCFNGFEPPLTEETTEHILTDIFQMILDEQIIEYIDLVERCNSRGKNYGKLVRKYSYHFARIVSSLQHKNLFDLEPDETLAERLEKNRNQNKKGFDENESNSNQR